VDPVLLQRLQKLCGEASEEKDTNRLIALVEKILAEYEAHRSKPTLPHEANSSR